MPGQVNSETGTGSRFCFECYPAAVKLDKIPGNCQTKPGTTVPAGRPAIDLMKSFKNSLHVLRDDSGAGVFYKKFKLLLATGQFQLDFPSRRSEFKGV